MQPRVLIIEDYVDAREVYAEFLRCFDFECIEAVDGPEGLAKTLECKPDVIVLDAGLPRLGGFEVARRLRADPATSAIPIICLSGDSRLGFVERALQAGCSVALGKPCNPDELLAAIRKLLHPVLRSA